MIFRVLAEKISLLSIELLGTEGKENPWRFKRSTLTCVLTYVVFNELR